MDSDINSKKGFHLKPWHLPAVSTFQLFKSILSIKYGDSIKPDYVKRTGDFFGLFGSAAVWLYLHITTIRLSTFCIALPLLLNSIGRMDWLEIFGHLRQKRHLDKLFIFDGKSLKRFLLISRTGFQLLLFSHYFFVFIFAAMFLLGYVYTFGLGWELLFICLPSLLIFSGFLLNVCTSFIIPVAYFTLYAYCVTIRLKLQNRFWQKTYRIGQKFLALKTLNFVTEALENLNHRDKHCNLTKKRLQNRMRED